MSVTLKGQNSRARIKPGTVDRGSIAMGEGLTGRGPAPSPVSNSYEDSYNPHPARPPASSFAPSVLELLPFGQSFPAPGRGQSWRYAMDGTSGA